MANINITQVRNALSLNDDDTEFDLEINHPKYGWIPYTLKAEDEDMTIDNSALLKLIGKDFTKITQDEKDRREALTVRGTRDDILTNFVDPVMTNSIRWASLSESKQNEWKKYRQDLLDIPQQSGFPHDVTYPTQPD